MPLLKNTDKNSKKYVNPIVNVVSNWEGLVFHHYLNDCSEKRKFRLL